MGGGGVQRAQPLVGRKCYGEAEVKRPFGPTLLCAGVTGSRATQFMEEYHVRKTDCGARWKRLDADSFETCAETQDNTWASQLTCYSVAFLGVDWCGRRSMSWEAAA